MPKEIGLEDVRRLIEEGAQLVDVLPAREYEEEHLPGAINVPLKTLHEASVAQLDSDRPIVVHCWDFQ
jgi:rhodanese-related sulfurtransferase